jgi:hypothetical protein
MTPLEDLRWRAEILQALYWMVGEGLASEIDAPGLARFLAVDESTITRHMETLRDDGYLVSSGVLYRLTRIGMEEGGRSFRDEFGDYIHPAHAECGPGCWCRDPKHAGEPCPSELVP